MSNGRDAAKAKAWDEYNKKFEGIPGPTSQNQARSLADFSAGWDARADQTWIPIRSEADWPKEDGRYWVTEAIGKNNLDVDYYDFRQGKWGFTDTEGFHVVFGSRFTAWQKNTLPEPYQQGENNE